MEELSQHFYSNCLVEAIKAKIKNPNIKIILHSNIGTDAGTIIPHFLWSCGNYVYDFGVDAKIRNPLLFKGCVRRMEQGDKQ